jgi:hypothetical protein
MVFDEFDCLRGQSGTEKSGASLDSMHNDL